MFGARISVKRGSRDEAEKPFWISFADLMTALMVLFLVVMGVELLTVTKTVTDQEKLRKQHLADVDLLLTQFEQAAARYEGIKVDRNRAVIDFHDRARFAFARSTLLPEQESALRQFVPEMLELADGELGRRVLKRFVVEGYTDKTGKYLDNLNLSLQRSQRVLCSMFALSGEHLLSGEQKQRVKDLFLVGGYSSNAARDTDEESRRVEMRLEFLGDGELRPAGSEVTSDFGKCALQ